MVRGAGPCAADGPVQSCARRRAGAGRHGSRQPCRGRDLLRQCRGRGRASHRAGLCRAPVRRVLAAAWRWTRPSAGRGDRPERTAPGYRSEGVRAHALLAAGRRQGGAWPGAARIPDRRGDACPWHPHDARAGRRDHGRGDPARGRHARRGPDPRCREPYPRRHLPVLRIAGRDREGGPPDRLHHRPPLPRSCGRGKSGSCPARCRRLGPGRPDRGLDGRRVHPWRDEHRQHDALGRDHRLRPLRLPGRLCAGHGL